MPEKRSAGRVNRCTVLHSEAFKTAFATWTSGASRQPPTYAMYATGRHCTQPRLCCATVTNITMSALAHQHIQYQSLAAVACQTASAATAELSATAQLRQKGPESKAGYNPATPQHCHKLLHGKQQQLLACRQSSESLCDSNCVADTAHTLQPHMRACEQCSIHQALLLCTHSCYPNASLPLGGTAWQHALRDRVTAPGTVPLILKTPEANTKQHFGQGNIARWR